MPSTTLRPHFSRRALAALARGEVGYDPESYTVPGLDGHPGCPRYDVDAPCECGAEHVDPSTGLCPPCTARSCCSGCCSRDVVERVDETEGYCAACLRRLAADWHDRMDRRAGANAVTAVTEKRDLFMALCCASSEAKRKAGEALALFLRRVHSGNFEGAAVWQLSWTDSLQDAALLIQHARALSRRQLRARSTRRAA